MYTHLRHLKQFLLNMSQFCLQSLYNVLHKNVHSFVGGRGQVRPTGVSAGECQGHQQSLTPLNNPKPPLQPSQPKFEPMQSVAMFHHTTKPTQPQPMECVSLFFTLVSICSTTLHPNQCKDELCIPFDHSNQCLSTR